MRRLIDLGDRKERTDALAALSLWWAILLLFLPPSVVTFRNPPPANFTQNWWLRFTVAYCLFAFNSYALFILQNKNDLSYRLIHWASSGVAIFVVAGLFLCVLEYPVLFGLSLAVSTWLGR